MSMGLERLNRRWPWAKLVILGIILVSVFWGGTLLFTGIGERGENVAPESATLEDSFKTDSMVAGLGGLDLRRPERVAATSGKGAKNKADKKRSKKQPEKTAAIKRAEAKQRRLAKLRQAKGKKLIALTFDDGPTPGQTDRLLDILRQKKVKATFFVVGVAAERAPDLVMRAYQEGHTVGNHSTSHKDLSQLGAVEIRQDIEATNRIITQILGGVRPEFVRPPYGAINQVVLDNVGLPAILWNIDPRDWEVRETETIFSHVVGHASDGAIALMHDVYGSTVDAVPKIIDALAVAGYEFVTVDELALLKNGTLAPGQVYFNF